MRPLEDVRIVAVEQYGAGPFGSLHLADLGAEVIKIEDPGAGGDVGRYVPPFAEGGDSLFFETFNRNKRSIELDLTSEVGYAVFLDLVRNADAVYSNLRGDTPARLRIRYDDLKAINPHVVCCALTGFGMTGPRSADPAYDYVLQGLAGWMDITGEPDGPPTKSGLSLVDYCGGMVAAMALLAGVHAARRDGLGADCDVSLYDTAMSMLTYLATWHLTGGYTPARTSQSAHPSMVPFQAFETADGWIVVACPKEKFWQRLVDVIGRDELRNARFATFDGRRQHRNEVVGILQDAFLTRATDAWLAVLQPAGIPCGPVHSVAEALADPHAVARGLIVETEHPRFGTVRQVASPVRVGDQPILHRRAPRQGEDSDALLTGLLGYTAEQIDSLRSAGAFG